MKSLLRDQRGQSMTELALLLPVLLLLLCGMLDLGRVMYAYLHLNLAAQETVRLGGLGRTDADMVTFARGYVHLGSADRLTVTISPPQAQRRSGQYVRVELRYGLSYLTPLASRVLPLPSVTADSTIRVE